MLKTLDLLNNSRVISKYDIIDYKQGSRFYYIKISADVINQTILNIKIYVSENDYNYSFHWQDYKGNLLIRWDNSPHHKSLKTFPYHKHVGNFIESSKEITLEDVVNYIESQI